MENAAFPFTATVPEVADQLGLAREKVAWLAREGWLPGFKTGPATAPWRLDPRPESRDWRSYRETAEGLGLPLATVKELCGTGQLLVLHARPDVALVAAGSVSEYQRRCADAAGGVAEVSPEEMERRAAAALALEQPLLRYLAGRCGDWHAAEDLFAEVMILALSEPVSPDPREHGARLRQHCHAVADRQRLRNLQVRAGVERWCTLDVPDPALGDDGAETVLNQLPDRRPGVVDEALGRVLLREVWQAAQRLSKPQQQLVQALAAGSEAHELAGLYGVDRYAMHARVALARRRLTGALGG